MKTSMTTIIWSIAAVLCAMAAIPETLRAAPTNSAAQAIGVYDSRVIAYAYFSSDANQRRLKDKIQAAREAQAAGETNRFHALQAELVNEQQEAHLEVFGSATPANALAALHDRLPLILQKAGASSLVSKWDDATLKLHPDALQIDLTDILADEFHPNEQQRKTIASIKRAKPLSAREIMNAEP